MGHTALYPSIYLVACYVGNRLSEVFRCSLLSVCLAVGG